MHLYRRKQNVIDNPQSNLPANQLQSFFHNCDLHIQLTSSVECFALWPKQKPSLQVIFFNQTVYGIWLISLHFIDMRQCNCKSLVKNCFPEEDAQLGCPLSWMHSFPYNQERLAELTSYLSVLWIGILEMWNI